MPVRKLTPQQKKQLSYERDGRNAYGENDKGSRKAIPRRKRGVARAYRRATAQLLPRDAAAHDGDAVEAAEARVSGLRRPGWRKCADTPLGTFVELQREKRLQRAGRKGYSKAASKVGRLLQERCAASSVIGADDLSYEISLTNAMDKERRGTTLVLLHAPTRITARGEYELPSGRPAADYREAIARMVGDVFGRLEAAVRRETI